MLGYGSAARNILLMLKQVAPRQTLETMSAVDILSAVNNLRRITMEHLYTIKPSEVVPTILVDLERSTLGLDDAQRIALLRRVRNVLDQVSDTPASVEPQHQTVLPGMEVKAEAPKTAAVEAPVKEKKARTPQPHIALIGAWMNTVGSETIPADVKIGSFARLGKNLLEGGVTVESMTCAAQVYKAYIDTAHNKPTLTWNVGEVTTAVRQALALCKVGVDEAKVRRFIQDKQAESFWNGKTFRFSYVADSIGAWLGDTTRQPKRKADCPKCHGKGHYWSEPDAENEIHVILCDCDKE